MKIVVIPGVNSLGKTKGVEKSFKRILDGFNFEKINLNNENIFEQLNQIFKKSKKYFRNKKCFFFGGDHSISFPLVSNFFEEFKNRSNLLIFDAHPDTIDPMQEPGHEEWLRAIIEKGFPIENILVVGIRKQSKNIDIKEINYLENKNIDFIYSDDFKGNKKKILEFIKNDPLYISFDIDVFDSSIVSCTGYSEENGLNEEQVFSILEEIVKKENFFFDLVEINLEKGFEEEQKKTVNISRKILKTILGE